VKGWRGALLRLRCGGREWVGQQQRQRREWWGQQRERES